MNKKRASLVLDFFRRADMLLFALCMVSSIFGMVIISSATKSYNNSHYLVVQIGALVIGIVLYFIFTVIDIDIIADKWPLLFIFSVLFMLTLVVWGKDGGTGNTGWLRFFGIGIQPAEVVKVVYIVLMSKQISYLKSYKDLNSPLSIIQIVAHFGFMFVLIVGVSSDLGSALVFLAIFLVLIFVAGVKFYWFLLGGAAVAALIPVAWSSFFTERQKQRILAPYDASVDPDGYGIRWQMNQSKIALASGQMKGTGLGNGPQSQSEALSQKHTDFIFAVAGEELGLIGCCVIILLLCLIIVRCVMVGVRSRNTFNTLVCCGVAATVFFQTFENIGMCIGLTPVIGLTLPFFSYGGSSLFSMMAAMGLVSGIRYRPKPQRNRANL